MPVNAVCLSGTVASVRNAPSKLSALSNGRQLYGLIFLGSTTAFSAMVSAAIIFLQTSCIVPQAILLYRGRDKVLPQRYFSLGRYGVVVNATSVIWVLFLDVIYCCPTAMPVTIENMNYVSVVVVGLVTFVLSLWFISKKGEFAGPRINMAELEEKRVAAMRRTVVTEGVEQDEVGIASNSKGGE
jgi:choline transport protein